MPYDVFISYSSEDKSVADAVCSTLEGQRIRCWIAPRDIQPGSDWAESIINGIEKCKVMILVFSIHSNSSAQVFREIERAVSKGLVIVPFRLQDVPFSKSLEYFVSSSHWLDALTPPLESHINRLAKTMGLLLSRLESDEPEDDLSAGTASLGFRQRRDLIEQRIAASDPRDLVFKEIEVKLSDTWDAFLAWLSIEVGDMVIVSISEDCDSQGPSFGCSGKPGHLTYRLVVEGNRGGIAIKQKIDVLCEWLHPLVLNLEPTRQYAAWDTALWQVELPDKKIAGIPHPLARCRDSVYWVLFAKPRT